MYANGHRQGQQQPAQGRSAADAGEDRAKEEKYDRQDLSVAPGKIDDASRQPLGGAVGVGDTEEQADTQRGKDHIGGPSIHVDGLGLHAQAEDPDEIGKYHGQDPAVFLEFGPTENHKGQTEQADNCHRGFLHSIGRFGRPSLYCCFRS